MKRFAHGENSITFEMFMHFTQKQVFRLIQNAEWTHRPKLKLEDIEAIHLFPNFGKRYGYGEPDAIILAQELVVYVEVELADFSLRRPPCFVRQMRMFVKLAKDLENTGTTRLRRVFEGESGYKFYGQQRLRRLFGQIKKEKRSPAFLVVSAGEVCVQELAEHLGVDGDVSLGWIGFTRVKTMEGVSSLVEVINHNLRP